MSINKIDEIWKQMDENEKLGCKFSMIPKWAMDRKLSTEELLKLMELSRNETGGF